MDLGRKGPRKGESQGGREGGSKRARRLLVRQEQGSVFGSIVLGAGPGRELRALLLMCPPVCRAFIAAKASCSDGDNVVITAADVEDFKAMMNTQRATARAHRR